MKRIALLYTAFGLCLALIAGTIAIAAIKRADSSGTGSPSAAEAEHDHATDHANTGSDDQAGAQSTPHEPQSGHHVQPREHAAERNDSGAQTPHQAHSDGHDHDH